jgi:hypothetical protein
LFSEIKVTLSVTGDAGAAEEEEQAEAETKAEAEATLKEVHVSSLPIPSRYAEREKEKLRARKWSRGLKTGAWLRGSPAGQPAGKTWESKPSIGSTEIVVKAICDR